MVETGVSVTPAPDGCCAVLVLEGEFEAGAIAIFEDAISRLSLAVPLIADLTAVTFVGSTGIHALFRAAQSRRLAALVRPSDSHLARVLDIVRAETVLPLFDDLAQAMHRLRTPERSVATTPEAETGRNACAIAEAQHPRRQ